MRWAFAAALAAALAGCATGGPRDLPPGTVVVANPSAVVATELAFARAARERGQWTAFREYAAEDATMFVPQPVRAQDWLKGRADPAQAMQWQVHQVWMSCDGSLAVTQGAAQWPDGRPGRFATVWKRQRDGSYRWVMDEGDLVSVPLAAPDFIRTEVASCDPLPPMALRVGSAGETWSEWASADRTLHARARVDAWCGRMIGVRVFRGNGHESSSPGTVAGAQDVLSITVPPPVAPAGNAPPRACAG